MATGLGVPAPWPRGSQHGPFGYPQVWPLQSDGEVTCPSWGLPLALHRDPDHPHITSEGSGEADILPLCPHLVLLAAPVATPHIHPLIPLLRPPHLSPANASRLKGFHSYYRPGSVRRRQPSCPRPHLGSPRALAMQVPCGLPELHLLSCVTCAI